MPYSAITFSKCEITEFIPEGPEMSTNAWETNFQCHSKKSTLPRLLAQQNGRAVCSIFWTYV